MEREAPLEPEVEQLQKSTDGEDGGGEDAPFVPSGVSEASSNLAADDGQENKRGNHEISPELVEDGNKYSSNRDGSQRQKEHQVVRKKDKSHHRLHRGPYEEEMQMSKNSCINLSQTPESGQNLPLKKRPLKSATCHTDKKEYYFLEQGESSKQSQEGTGTATREKSSECSTSDKGLRVNSDPQVIRSSHLEKKSYKHEECGMSYKGTLGLKRDQNDHTGEIPYKYAKAHLHRYHLRQHQRLYECKICGKSFKSSTTLAFHQQTHTGERPYKCNECGKAFRQPGYLIHHKRKHTGEKTYKCEECGRSYRHSSSLTVHLRSHTGERPYKCDECRKAFKQYAHLKKHKRIHIVLSLCKCKICGKNYKYSTSLAYHQQTHTGERPYNCDECGKAFKQSADLTKHKRTHTGETPYKCDECGKAFKQSGDLTKHKRIHTGERPYKCDECGKAFNRSEHLTRHKQTHTGERPYKCDECGKAFMQSGDLTKHKRTHTGEKPYKCDECGKAFNRSEHLRRHKQIHTGERPYKCEECGKAFQRQSSLKSHKRIHTGEKPYRCDSCGMAFKWYHQLSQHQQTHTEDDGQEDKGGIHPASPERVEDGNEHNNNRDGTQGQKERQGKWRKDKPCPHLRGDASEEEMGMSKNRCLSVPQSPESVQKMPLKKRPLKSATGHAEGKKYYHSEQGESSKQSQEGTPITTREKSHECSTSDKGIRVNSHP